jgi:TDG/mug DNA glycosylase family protein
MPSRTSLENNQYYANPNNSFWWIMSEIIGFSLSSAYQDRVDALTANGFAVWDSLYDCQRVGSLDSNIQLSSEIPNDIAGLIESHPSIRLIVFNGGAAKQIFMRHCASLLQDNQHIQWVQMPSTSPAYAAMPKAKKLAVWREVLLAGKP